jgi:Domain of unknown function (DUF4123)
MPELITSAVASVAELRQVAARGGLCAILDACDEPRVPIRVAALGSDAAPLYQGKAQEELWAIAPYLVRVDPDALMWITESLWTDPWGVFVISDAPLEAVRTHFRRFLLVDAPDGGQWYFRFYDPRVLAKFLPTCDAAQVTDFFGPVEAFGWVDLDTYGVTLTRQKWFDPGVANKPRIAYRKVAL